MRAYQFLPEAKAIKTSRGTVIESPNKDVILNILQKDQSVRGVLFLNKHFVGSGVDMVHANIANAAGTDLYATKRYGLEIHGGEAILSLMDNLKEEDLPMSVQSCVIYANKNK